MTDEVGSPSTAGRPPPSLAQLILAQLILACVNLGGGIGEEQGDRAGRVARRPTIGDTAC